MALAQAANGEESPACRRYDMPAPREQKLLAANSGQHHRMSDAFYYIADTFASIEGTRTVTAADGTTHTVPLDLSQPALENYRRSLAAEDQLLSAAVRDKEKSNTLTCMGRILRSTQSYLEAERHLLRALDLNALNWIASLKPRAARGSQRGGTCCKAMLLGLRRSKWHGMLSTACTPCVSSLSITLVVPLCLPSMSIRSTPDGGK
jgi:hypothetical protein